jgi:uncharacterized phage protein gp47/JayE
MPTFQITPTGIETARFQDARDYVVSLWKSKFGSNSQTGSDSPNGQIIDVMALMLTLIWQGTTATYNAGYFRSAVGVQLDRLLDLVGIKRLGSRASTVTLTCYGNSGVTVPLGTVATADDSESSWSTVASVATSDAIRVVRVLTFQAGTYTVTIDGTPYTAVAPAPNADLDAVTNSLITAIDAGEGTGTARFIGVEASTSGTLIRLSNMAGRTVTVTHSVTPGNIAVTFAVDSAAECTVDGPTDALVGTIRTLAAPIAGIVAVINEFDAVPGRLDETDAEYRERWLDRMTIAGRSTPDRIRAAVLDVDGVTFARVFENESDVVDGDGRPPHCFQVVVRDGDDNEIAQAIWENKPAGILSYGTTASGNAIDSQGITRVIDFDRPTVRYLWLDIEVTDGEGFPTTGDPVASIRDAVLAWCNANLTVGSDLYRIQVAGAITTAIPGIAAITVETDDTPSPAGPPSYSNADITVSDVEILIADSSRITVTIL